MKKSIIFLFILASILSACLSPSEDASQVTVTPEPTATFQSPTNNPALTATVAPDVNVLTLADGLKIILGEANESGITPIEEFIAPDEMSREEVAILFEQFDETRLGLEGDWVKVDDGRVILLDDINDPMSILAEYKIFVPTGTMQVVVDGDKLVVDNENVVLSQAEVEEWRGGLPVHYDDALESDKKLIEEGVTPTKIALAFGLPSRTPAGYILSADQSQGVWIRYSVYNEDGSLPSQDQAHKSQEGIVFFRNKTGGYTHFFVENFELQYID